MVIKPSQGPLGKEGADDGTSPFVLVYSVSDFDAARRLEDSLRDGHTKPLVTLCVVLSTT